MTKHICFAQGEALVKQGEGRAERLCLLTSGKITSSFLRRVLNADNRIFTKTGSGQTQEKLPKKRATTCSLSGVSLGVGAAPARHGGGFRDVISSDLLIS